jgi:prepilin-type N-terminal cleavage/methylation domain-containing protein
MTRNARKGFTLIELLIVVVIIGILAAVAIPKFANTKEKAYVSAMKSDLKNLATAMEAYAEDNDGAYGVIAAGKAGLTGGKANKTYWVPSSGVEAAAAGTGDDKGWGLTLKRTGTAVVCEMWSGDAATHKTPKAAKEGEPHCE